MVNTMVQLNNIFLLLSVFGNLSLFAMENNKSPKHQNVLHVTMRLVREKKLAERELEVAVREQKVEACEEVLAQYGKDLVAYEQKLDEKKRKLDTETEQQLKKRYKIDNIQRDESLEKDVPRYIERIVKLQVATPNQLLRRLTPTMAEIKRGDILVKVNNDKKPQNTKNNKKNNRS